jgi:hypothetical protein
MKKVIQLSIFILAAACCLLPAAYGQSRPYEIRRPCPNSSSYATVTISASGGVTVTPCAGKTLTLPTTVTGRIGLTNIPTGGTSGQVLSTNGSGTGSWVSTKTFALMPWQNSTLAAGSTTQYAAPGGVSSVGATEAARQVVFPYAGTIKNLYVNTTGAQPADGAVVITIRKCTPTAGACTGVDQAVTLTITAAATANTFSDTTHSFSFAAGDLISVKIANAATTSAALATSISFEVDTP